MTVHKALALIALILAVLALVNATFGGVPVLALAVLLLAIAALV